MSHYIDSILEDREKKRWEGKINRKVLVTGLIIGLLIVGVISLFLFHQETIPYTSDKGSTGEISGSLIGIIFLSLGILFTLWRFFAGIVTEYSITNKRIIIKSGIIGTDYKSIYFEQMVGVVVDVGIVGKIFRTGNIKIDTGKTDTYSVGGHSKNSRPSVRTRTMHDVLRNIDSPYVVYKILQPAVTSRRESLYSGRADRESNPESYRE